MRSQLQRARNFEALESRHLLSATSQLLADINLQQSAAPQDLVEYQGRLYFTAEHPDFGREIWSTDGTVGGTQLLVDLQPGSNGSLPGNLVVSGDYLYFVASVGGTGSELWRTNGTVAGTLQLADINPGSASSVLMFDEMVDVAGTLFFVADDGENEGLWKSDGSLAGTELVKVIGDGWFSISDLVTVGDTLYFLGDDDVLGEELWKSDGTTAGTVMVKDIRPGSSDSWGSDLIAYQDSLYFIANDGSGYALWTSDGTNAGTQKAALPVGVSNFASLTVSGDWLYFRAQNSASGTELWRTDGTLAGTTLVVDLVPGSMGSAPNSMFDVGGMLYFTATINGEMNLARTDGTAAGTQVLASLNQHGEAPYIREMAALNGVLYFTTYSNVFGADLWRSDGTSLGTYVMQGGIAPAGSSSTLVVAGSQLFFTANVGGTGKELWRSTGDYASTRRLTDFVPTSTDPSNPENFVTAGGRVYFTADDGYGRQLWTSNGQAGNAVRLTHSYFGLQSGQIGQLTPVGDLLYFVGRDVQGKSYLGVSDGTPQGTRPLAWPPSVAASSVFGLMAFGDGVIFTAHVENQGLAVFTADAEHIELIHLLGAWGVPGPSFDGHVSPVTWQGSYYFLASGQQGFDVWRSDGTSAGTEPLRNIAPQLGRSMDSLTVTDSAVYFMARSNMGGGQAGLWRTDGTAAGTYHLPNVWPSKLFGAGDKLFFTAPMAGYPFDVMLWSTDGTPEGTRQLQKIFDESSGAPTPPRLKAVSLENEVFFFGPSSMSPFMPALWRTDGTAAGTVPVPHDQRFIIFSRVDLAVDGGKVLVMDGWNIYASDGTGLELLTSEYAYNMLMPFQSAITELNGRFYYSGRSSANPAYEPHFAEFDKPVTIVGRHLFYNQSKFDGPSAVLNDADDNVIAPDKTPYLPGSGTATFDNISSYVRGINGVMIDFANLPPASTPVSLSLDDFVFRIGSSNDLGTWTAAPAPVEWSFRYPTGDPQDLTRISFRWANNAIANTWLEITVLANKRTGLEKPDVFYFGNRIGDTGSGTPTAAITGAADELAVRNNPGVGRPITSLLDFDRNGITNAADAIFARNNGGVLLKLNLPAPTEAGPLVAAPLIAAEDDEVSLDVIAAPVAETLVAASSAEQPSPRGTLRSDLLAFALQRWNDLLNGDADDDEDGLAGLFAARGRRS